MQKSVFMVLRKFGKIYGFTIAEVLITLGIIGLVAQMTIPTLMQDVSDKIVVVQLKKEINVLQQAVDTASIDYGPIEGWYAGSNYTDAKNKVAQILQKYLKTIKVCEANDTCSPTYMSPAGSNSYNGPFDLNSSSILYLADGSSVAIEVGLIFGQSQVISFYIDVNGNKNPNRYVYDLFNAFVCSDEYAAIVHLRPYRIMPAGEDGMIGDLKWICSTTLEGEIGDACTAWAYYQGNLDYKYVDDLNWQTKTHK